MTLVSGVLLVGLVAVIAYMLVVTRDRLEPRTRVPIGTIGLAGVYGVRRVLGARRHRLVLVMRDKTMLKWTSRPGEHASKRACVGNVLDLARARAPGRLSARALLTGAGLARRRIRARPPGPDYVLSVISADPAPASRPPALGLRHVALRVRDLAGVEDFFVRLFGYDVEWRPDPENVYLTRGDDNLALHRAADADGPGLLDHLGLFVPRAEDVDAWERWLDQAGATLKARPRTHRDGTRSLYVAGPERIVVQLIHHPRAPGG